MMKLIVSILLVTQSAWGSNYIDKLGREWMRLDQTFQISKQVPALCRPQCSGKVGDVSLDGWIWADRAEVQSLFDELRQTFLIFFGTSYQVLKGRTLVAGAYGSTSSIHPTNGLRFYGVYHETQQADLFHFSTAFVVGPDSWPEEAQIGAFLYRPMVR